MNTARATAAVAANRVQSIAQFQNWPASLYVLLFTLVAFVVVQVAWRPSFPKGAPSLVKADNWPILGVLRFFSDRTNFCHDAVAATKTGNFSFYFGKHRIVGVSGLEGRRTFFESKELNMSEGYAVLFTTTPSVEGSKSQEPGGASAFSVWFSRMITRMMKKENFVKNLPAFVQDTRVRLEQAVVRTATSKDAATGKATGIMDPFDDIYRIVYHLTMRTVGATEIAESPELLEKTLKLFEQIEASNSPARIIFPWLPTPAHLRRMGSGARLYMIFNKIIEDRKKTGRRLDDSLQFLMDTGEDTVKILTFVLGALFAGQLNSGINAAWLFVYLATNPDWYARVRDEVDSVIAKKRTSPSQTAADVLGSLDLDDWEGELPLIDLSLRETIRFQLVGTAFRRNISGRDVTIGSTGEVVPADSFALFQIDNVHFDPNIYAEPNRWDPGRYLPDRAEDKKEPAAYVGWGTGRHPCLGMRFAKLEMAIIAAMFVAMFDYELVDTAGKRIHDMPVTNRNNHSASKPDMPLRLRYTTRQP